MTILPLALVFLFAVSACSVQQETTPETRVQPPLEAFNDYERQVQDYLVECMALHGWDYFPEEPDIDVVSYVPDDGLREWTREYGYGYSTRFEEAFATGQSRIDASLTKNEQYRSGLSDEELGAYDESLYGSNPFDGYPTDPETGRPIDPSTGQPLDLQSELANIDGDGCEAEATASIPLPESIEDWSEADLSTEDAVDVQSQSEWQTCMRSAGYDFDTEAEILEELEIRLAPIEAAAYESLPPETGDENDDPKSDELLELDLDTDLHEELDAIQEWERELALASLDCRE